MTVDMVVNIIFVLFIGSIFGVLAASNLGYVLAHMFALSGFVLLRRDRPNWPRPIKLGRIWTPIAGLLAVWCLILTIVGFGWFQNAAGGMTAVAQANAGLAMRYQGLWREVFQLAQQAAQERTESLTRLMSVRSPQQLLDVNIDLMQREAQRFFDGQARLSQLSADAALDAKQRIQEATSALKQGKEAAQGKGREGRRAA